MGKKFLVLCIILLIHFQQIGFFFPLADTDSTPRTLGHKDIGYLPYQGIGSSVCIDAEICLCCWNLFASFTFWCYKAYKNGKCFIYPERKIFGVHNRYVKIRRETAAEWLTIKQSGSQKPLQRRGTLIMNMPGVLPWT